MGIIIKNPSQIDGIRKSCQLAANTLKHLEQYVVPGVTTNFLNNRAEEFIRDHGALPAPLNYQGYPKATCISLNEVICHGIPNDTIIREGDIFNVDVTTILDGYYGDTSTMYSVGEISEEAEHLLKVTKKCLDIGIKQVKPGNYFSQIGDRIFWYATLQNCSVVYQYCAHGTGFFFFMKTHILVMLVLRFLMKK